MLRQFLSTAPKSAMTDTLKTSSASPGAARQDRKERFAQHQQEIMRGLLPTDAAHIHGPPGDASPPATSSRTTPSGSKRLRVQTQGFDSEGLDPDTHSSGGLAMPSSQGSWSVAAGLDRKDGKPYLSDASSNGGSIDDEAFVHAQRARQVCSSQ